MVLGEVISWFRELMKFLITSAPYPLKVAFWIFAFLSMASIMNFFFTFSVLCTTDGTPYKPDSAMWAVRGQFKRMMLSNNIDYNYTGNSSDAIPDTDVGVIDRVVLCVTHPTDCFIDKTEYNIKYGGAKAVEEARAYDSFIREHGSVISGDAGLIGVGCRAETAQLKIAGIPILNKELWLTLAVFLLLLPLFSALLNKR